MVGGVFYEHGHRMVAGAVAFLTVISAFALARAESRRWVRLLAYAAVVIVLSQAVLGGLTVLLRLPKAVSVSHAMLAQTFFCIAALIAVVTSTRWETQPAGYRPQDRGLFFISSLITFGFFIQLFLGASMRHLGAGLSIPDFPTVYGGFLPPVWTAGIAFHFFHRVLAYALTLACTLFALRVLRTEQTDRVRVFLAAAWMGLLAVQITLGALTIWLQRPVAVTSLHLAVGALCLLVSFLFTFRLGWASYGSK